MKKLNTSDMRQVEGGTIIYPGHEWWDINPWKNFGVGRKYRYACTGCRMALATNSWVDARGFQLWHMFHV